jgi:uncharacterized membrane protein
MSGLDDSLSDVGAKKKYPFELEKAIHNVMFIQHHMQRQDEFNAVSGTRNLLFNFFASMQFNWGMGGNFYGCAQLQRFLDTIKCMINTTRWQTVNIRSPQLLAGKFNLI